VDPEVISDAFNTFFLTITENLNLYQEVRDDAILFLKEAFPRKFCAIETIPTTETEIKSIMYSLKARNSSGYDQMISKILKVFASLISRPLTRICNHYSQGSSLIIFKISLVKPLYKNWGLN
jgi:hypothetical protein